MGATHILSSFRQPETGSIADMEAEEGGGSVPMRTYGPYRSEYGRLCEFPNLPPLLVKSFVFLSMSLFIFFYNESHLVVFCAVYAFRGLLERCHTVL